MSMEMILRRMKVQDATMHGFRSSFRDWVGNETQFPRESGRGGAGPRRRRRRRAGLPPRRRAGEAPAADGGVGKYCDKKVAKPD